MLTGGVRIHPTVSELLPTVITTNLTIDGSGAYSFGPAPAGSYNVVVTTATLPSGLTPTYDTDGVGTVHSVAFVTTSTSDAWSRSRRRRSAGTARSSIKSAAVR